MRIETASDSSLLVRFGEGVSAVSHREVMALFRALRSLRDARIHNLHPSYASLLIEFDPLRMGFKEVEEIVARALRTPSQHERPSRLVEIPVCYDDDFGPDLSFVAARSGRSPAEVVGLHSAAEYTVHFLGFSPGFGYLGGLPDALESPRLETPRKHVAAGSVGIAGIQTGVYPVDSPGGWRLIGRTPLRMFDPLRDPPTKLQPGDAVRFVAIDRAGFDKMLAAGSGS